MLGPADIPHVNAALGARLVTRGGQIIRSWRGPHLQCIADALHCVADEDQRGRSAARTAKVPKRGKRVKNADNAENTRMVQEKRQHCGIVTCGPY